MKHNSYTTTRLILRFAVSIICCFVSYGIIAQVDSARTTSNSLQSLLKPLSISAYGALNYYAYDWETLPDRRNAIDPERLNLYMYYQFSPRIELKTEIEFEHGGTGSTLSFDPLEEFGEFEQEVEKGGEVVLEQMHLMFRFSQAFNIRVGRMRVYMGNAATFDEPTEYFTAYRSEIENTILPLGWYETGIELGGSLKLHQEQEFPRFEYKAYVISGLDNTGFNSYNWIRAGYQTRFETSNADNLAYALRTDYVFGQNCLVGISAYACNATGNRPKKDFTTDSWVTFGDVHFALFRNPWRVTGYGMAGNVQNSDLLSNANRNLSNNLNVKRTPVGKVALGGYLEAGYDLLHVMQSNSEEQLFIFGRAEWYDSMYRTEGNISDNPRYERQVFTTGVNYFPHEDIVFKAHYAWRTLGSGEHERTFALGIGFEF